MMSSTGIGLADNDGKTAILMMQTLSKSNPGNPMLSGNLAWRG